MLTPEMPTNAEGGSSRLRPVGRGVGRRSSAWLVLLLVGMVALVRPDVVSAWAGEQRPVEGLIGQLDERIGELMADYDVPGVVVALIREGELVWTEAYGYADIETGRPMTVDTVNRAESISKSVTAWGVMTLVEDGRLGLDDPIVDYIDVRALPEARFPVEAVTVRQLLSHTAGVSMGTIGREFPPDGSVPSLEESLNEQFQLVSEPGSGFLYSNTGFNLLELLVEEVAGEDFASYMQREILEPLGMHDSSFVWSDDLTPPVPVGYDLQGNPVPGYVYPEKGSGGLFATVEDIARFVSAGMTGSYAEDHGVLEPATIDVIHTPEAEITGLFRFVSPSYGLGHFVESLSSGHAAVWHGGQGHGWMTDFHSVPVTGDGIVMMVNSQRSWPLIAQVLTEWSQWSGLSPVGFSIIAGATTVLWFVVWIVGLGSVLHLLRLGSGLARQTRRIGPLSAPSRIVRSVQGTLSATLLSVLAWNSAQDYSLVSSVFPKVSGWLGAAIFGLAIALLLSAATRRVEKNGTKSMGETDGV